MSFERVKQDEAILPCIFNGSIKQVRYIDKLIGDTRTILVCENVAATIPEKNARANVDKIAMQLLALSFTKFENVGTEQNAIKCCKTENV